MAKGLLEQAKEIAAGARRATCADLIELIRAANPTGRDLPPRIEEERYRLKSRLQSVLVARFGVEIKVERTADPAVVGLVHRLSGTDACHARVDDLDEQARAWVRFQLDVADETSAPRRVETTRSDAVTDPLERGRRALAEYDYEEARTVFQQAFDGGSAEAGIALLELLVDTLGAFGEAIAFEPRLPKTDPRVRVILALAYARIGSRNEARRRVEGLDDPRAAEVWAALASGAVADGSLEEAEGHITSARARDLRHPELVEAEAALACKRAERRAPDEEKMRDAWQRGDVDEAERIARAIGGSPAARILREIEARRREAEAARLLAEARAALARGEDASELARRAAALGASDPEVDTEIARKLEETKEREREARVAWIVDHLQERSGLQAYLDADEALRARVRARHDRPLLEWAVAMGSAEAALALESGVGIDRHEALLNKIPEGREALRKKRDAEDEQKRAEARSSFAEAAERAARGDTRWARDLLERIDRKILGEPDREAAEDLLARLRREEADVIREERIESALLAKDPIEALALARAGGDGWQERSGEIAEDLSRDWRLRVFECDVPLESADLPALEEIAWAHEVATLAVEGGTALYLTTRAGAWTVLLQIDVERERVVRVLRMCAPIGIGRPGCVLDGTSPWIAGSELIVELDAGSLALRGALRLSSFMGREDEMHTALLVPGTHWCWLQAEIRPEGEERVRVIDVRQRRIRCEVGDVFVSSVPGTDRVLGTGLDRGARLFLARGTTDERVRLPEDVRQLAAHPSGSGFVALVGRDDKESDYEIMVLAADGSVRFRERIVGADPQRVAWLAASADDGLVFGIVWQDRGAWELFAWRVAGSGLERLWRQEVPRESSLVTDLHSRQVFLLAGNGGRLHALQLGSEPPALPLLFRQPDHFDFPDLHPPFTCRSHRSLSQLTPAELIALRGDRKEIDRLATKVMQDPAEFSAFLSMLGHEKHAATAAELLAAAAQLHPDHPELAFARAELAFASRDYRQVIEALGSRERPKLSVSPRHRAHLLGLAQLFEGDPDGARETWRKGLRKKGECRLDRCLAIVSAEETSLGRLVSAIRAADAVTDPEEKIRLLAPHWAANETQSRIRYADAWLQREAHTEWDRIRKLSAVAWLPLFRCDRDLPLPGATWTRAHILAITAAATAWLETET